MATFWASFGKIGLLFIPPTGHTACDTLDFNAIGSYVIVWLILGNGCGTVNRVVASKKRGLAV